MGAILAASWLATIALTAAGPQVAATLGDAAAARAGVTAELLTGAPGSTATALIDAVVKQDPVKASTERTVQGRQAVNPISSRGYVVGLGGALYFYYRDPAPAGAPAKVCRVRAAKNIRSPERLRAVRWCYEQLGAPAAR